MSHVTHTNMSRHTHTNPATCTLQTSSGTSMRSCSVMRRMVMAVSHVIHMRMSHVTHVPTSHVTHTPILQDTPYKLARASQRDHLCDAQDGESGESCHGHTNESRSHVTIIQKSYVTHTPILQHAPYKLPQALQGDHVVWCAGWWERWVMSHTHE